MAMGHHVSVRHQHILIVSRLPCPLSLPRVVIGKLIQSRINDRNQCLSSIINPTGSPASRPLRTSLIGDNEQTVPNEPVCCRGVKQARCWQPIANRRCQQRVKRTASLDNNAVWYLTNTGRDTEVSLQLSYFFSYSVRAQYGTWMKLNKLT